MYGLHAGYVGICGVSGFPKVIRGTFLGGPLLVIRGSNITQEYGGMKKHGNCHVYVLFKV